MIHLTFLLLSKLIAGGKNGAYYANNRIERNIYMIWLICAFIPYSITFTEPIYILPFMAIIIWQYWIFENNISKQIHLSENVLSGYTRFIMILSGASIPMMILTTGLQMVAFKMPINAYIGRDLIEKIDGTNDDTGKTYNVWIGKYEFHIPRISNGFAQLYSGIIGFGIWLILIELGLDFTLADILSYLESL
jgi:hypothetical protein